MSSWRKVGAIDGELVELTVVEPTQLDQGLPIAQLVVGPEHELAENTLVGIVGGRARGGKHGQEEVEHD